MIYRTNSSSWIASLLAVLVIATTACGRSDQPPTTASQEGTQKSLPRRVPGQAYLDQAQPKLRTVKLWLGANELITEVAASQTEIATGMMYRTEMAENEAMIFVFSRPFKASFYMRNTLIPLSCAYIGSDGTILEIHDMKPKDETPIEAATDKVQYVLEVNKGWFIRNNVHVGAVVAADKGTLSQVFFGR